MSSKKERPRSCLKKKIFNIYTEEIKEATSQFNLKKNYLNSDIEFSLFQNKKEMYQFFDMFFNLYYFYDTNFTGNRDFMHIPTVRQIMHNYKKYPIFLACQKNSQQSKEIVGAATVKFEKNNFLSDNPFFPTENEKILFITGVLTKKNVYDSNGQRVSGIGTELYKTAIKGAYNINKREKIRLICEIDCRNVNSLNSISKAVKELNDENINIGLSIVGYYEVYNQNDRLDEAPTFILEVDFNTRKKIQPIDNIELTYEKCLSGDKLLNISKVLNEKLIEIEKYVNFENNKRIVYRRIEKINALNIKIDVGLSAIGNERKSKLKSISRNLIPTNF